MLEEILGSRTKVRILRLLVGQPEREFTTRQLALAARQSLGAVHPALGQLVASRIVLIRRVGRSRVVRINRGHPLHGALAALFRGESSALLLVAREFADALPGEGLAAVVLFGSVARGEPGPRSDVDVLVVVDDPRRAPTARRVASSMLDRYDANVSPLVLSSVEVARRLSRFDPLLGTIASEGKLLRGRAEWLGR